MDACICLAGLIVIFVVIIVVVRRQSSNVWKQDSVDIAGIADSAPSLSGLEGIPEIKTPSDPKIALSQGKHLLAQGRRAEGVALLIHAFREGPPDVSQETSRVLEELGEIEIF